MSTDFNYQPVAAQPGITSWQSTSERIKLSGSFIPNSNRIPVELLNLGFISKITGIPSLRRN
jgi:hypothetical protein